jgi:hypothetical protein
MKEAVNAFRKHYSHLKISDMKNYVVKLNKWSLQFKQRPSTQCLNSHRNLSIYLII